MIVSMALLILILLSMFIITCLVSVLFGIYRHKSEMSNSIEVVNVGFPQEFFSQIYHNVYEHVKPQIVSEIESLKQTLVPYENHEFSLRIKSINNTFDRVVRDEIESILTHYHSALVAKNLPLQNNINVLQTYLENLVVKFDEYCSEMFDFVNTENGFDQEFMINNQLEMLYKMRDSLEVSNKAVFCDSTDDEVSDSDKATEIINNYRNDERYLIKKDITTTDFDPSRITPLYIVLMLLTLLGAFVDVVLFHGVITSLKIGMEGIDETNPLYIPMQSAQWILTGIVCVFGVIFMFKAGSEWASRTMRTTEKLQIRKFIMRVLSFILMFLLLGSAIFCARISYDGFMPAIHPNCDNIANPSVVSQCLNYVDKENHIAYKSSEASDDGDIDENGNSVISMHKDSLETKSIWFDLLLLVLFLGTGISSFIIGEKLGKPEFWDYRALCRHLSRISGNEKRLGKFYKHYADLLRYLNMQKSIEDELKKLNIESVTEQYQHEISNIKKCLLYDVYVHELRLSGIIVPQNAIEGLV